MSWSNRDIRRLLSLIRHPAKLEAAPLGLALRHATGTDSNLAAVTAIIDRSLNGRSAAEKLMRGVELAAKGLELAVQKSA